MVDWTALPVTFKPDNLCKNKPGQKEECVKAATAISWQRQPWRRRRKITGAVIINSWHTSATDSRNHLTLYFVDNYDIQITSSGYHMYIWASRIQGMGQSRKGEVST